MWELHAHPDHVENAFQACHAIAEIVDLMPQLGNFTTYIVAQIALLSCLISGVLVAGLEEWWAWEGCFQSSKGLQSACSPDRSYFDNE